MRTLLLGLSALLMNAEAQTDDAVIAVMKKADAEMVHVKVLKRSVVGVVIAIGSPKNLALGDGRWVPWTEKQKMGVFFVDKGGVFPLAIRPGSPGCVIRVERITSTEAVVACTKDGVQSTPMNHDFFYDLRERKLIAEKEYSPFGMDRGFMDAGGAVFVGKNSDRPIAMGYRAGSGFRVLNDTEAAAWTGRIAEDFRRVRLGAFTLEQEKGNSFGPRLVITGMGARYEMPQSSYDAFAKARPGRVKNNYLRANTEFDEQIGPFQVEGGKLWFGKTFYDGEGSSGVGGFGYFDPADKKYHLFAPAEMADWSVSAMLVEAETVWMALVQRGEYGGPSGGVLKFDRKAGTAERLEMPDFGTQFLRLGSDLLVATSGGVAVIHEGRVTRYFAAPGRDGRLRVVEAN